MNWKSLNPFFVIRLMDHCESNKYWWKRSIIIRLSEWWAYDEGRGSNFWAKIPKFLHIFSLMGGFDEWMNDPLHRVDFFFTHFYGKRGNFSRGKRVNQGKRFPTAHLHPVTWSFTRVLWECSDSFQTIFFGVKNNRSKGSKIWSNFGGKFLFNFVIWDYYPIC
jgi:hypothetical protein